MSKWFLMLGFTCCLYGIPIAEGVPAPLSDGEGTEESRLSIAGTPMVQFRAYSGMRTLEGDDRPYAMELKYSNGGSTQLFGEKFAPTKVSWGIGLAGETTIQLPLHTAFGLDLQFGTFLTFGAYVGGGYNLTVMKNQFWLQAKADVQWSLAWVDIGDIPVSGLIVNGKTIYDPDLSVSTTVFTLRPEVNAFYRITDKILLMAGAGYQLPFITFEPEFVFGGKDYDDKVVTERIKLNTSSISFSLEDKEIKKAKDMKISPVGLTINVAFVVEIY